MNRVLVTIPKELEQEFDKLKRDKFYNESRAEMLRYILQKGIASIKKEGATCSK